LCGQVCPTSAIRRLPLEEKTYAKMGTAQIDRTRCITWHENRICLICDEVCPYDAVGTIMRTVAGITTPRPFVREEICVGCGLCESRCPTPGPAAIQAFRVGEERRRTGTYITEEKMRLRHQEKYEETPSGFILEGN
jgi:formate hydrogenlyase subunit 6/NADH:ubiquinone oxidoreductase subunit I